MKYDTVYQYGKYALTPDQFRNALARLALHPDEAASFLGVHRSQIFRRLNGSVAVQASEAILLQLMLAMRWNVRDVMRRVNRSKEQIHD